MRKITLGPILAFLCLLCLAIAAALGTTMLVLGRLPLGDFRGVVLFCVGAILIYAYAIVLYRLFLRVWPLQEGSIEPGSRSEFGYQVYLLFYLLLFYPITRSRFMPVPIMRLVYQALGAKLGANTYSSGTIMDPPLTQVGDNTLIGDDAVLFAHAIEGEHLSHAIIRIGSNVTIGAKAIIMSGVIIGDGAIVGSGAVVRKATNIGPGEIWVGNPARKLER